MADVPVVVYLSNGVPLQDQANVECVPARTPAEQPSIRITFTRGEISGAAVGIGLYDILAAAGLDTHQLRGEN